MPRRPTEAAVPPLWLCRLVCWNWGTTSPPAFETKEAALMTPRSPLGSFFPCLEEQCTFAAKQLYDHPLGSKKSDSFPSFHPISISFRSTWQCICWAGWSGPWFTPRLISLSNLCWANPSVFSSEQAFSFFYNINNLGTFQIFKFCFLIAKPLFFSSIYFSLLTFS